MALTLQTVRCQALQRMWIDAWVRYHVIHNNPDDLISTPTAVRHIESLRANVCLVLLYGGDADRCLCVDEKVMWWTETLSSYICGKYMKREVSFSTTQW